MLALVVGGLLVVGLAIPFAIGEQRSGQDLGLTARERVIVDPTTGESATSTSHGGGSEASPLSSQPTAQPGGITDSGDSPGSPQAGAPQDGSAVPGAPSTPNTATDVGVTPDRIRFAFMIPDIGGAASSGFDLGLGDPADVMQHLVNQVNESGGVHGRLLEVVSMYYDALDGNDQTAKCVEANEDHRVFAGVVLTGYSDAAVTCFTDGYERILVRGSGQAAAVYPQSGGRLFTIGMRTTRVGANAAWELHRLGLLKTEDGRQLKVGVVHTEGLDGADVFVETLRAEGVEVEARSVSLGAQGQSQIPVRVNQLRAAGVEVVVLATNLINATLFVQQAEGQGWFPEYRVTDLHDLTVRAAAERMPRSFDGALGVTQWRYGEANANHPPQPAASQCLQSYGEHAGRQIDPLTTEAEVVVSTCAVFSVFVEGLRLAGSQLDTVSYSNGLRTYRGFEPAGAFTGSFGPSKFDASDQARIIRWNFDCKCYTPMTDPATLRF